MMMHEKENDEVWKQCQTTMSQNCGNKTHSFPQLFVHSEWATLVFIRVDGSIHAKSGSAAGKEETHPCYFSCWRKTKQNRVPRHLPQVGSSIPHLNNAPCSDFANHPRWARSQSKPSPLQNSVSANRTRVPASQMREPRSTAKFKRAAPLVLCSRRQPRRETATP